MHFEKNYKYILISEHYNISNMQIFGTISSTTEVDKDMLAELFFFFFRNFRLKHFLI